MLKNKEVIKGSVTFIAIIALIVCCLWSINNPSTNDNYNKVNMTTKEPTSVVTSKGIPKEHEVKKTNNEILNEIRINVDFDVIRKGKNYVITDSRGRLHEVPVNDTLIVKDNKNELMQYKEKQRYGEDYYIYAIHYKGNIVDK